MRPVIVFGIGLIVGWWIVLAGVCLDNHKLGTRLIIGGAVIVTAVGVWCLLRWPGN